MYRYTGQITYVLGEFYWKLERGQRTQNTDYAGPKGKKLNREQTVAVREIPAEWSHSNALTPEQFERVSGRGALVARTRDALLGARNGADFNAGRRKFERAATGSRRLTKRFNK